jgi:hypothetical protein
VRTPWLFAGLLALLPGAASAQADYRFSVPSLELHVTVNPDASATMEHVVTFQCSPGARPIDIVDVGLPHRGYDISNMSASLNGVTLSGIRKSTAIDCGVEVPLGPSAIPPGQSGIFVFRCTMPDMVYQDTTRKDYASLWVTPTWWGPQYVEGSGSIAVVVYLPTAIRPEEVLHQGQPFTLKGANEKHTVASWLLQGARADQAHLCKLSFPQRTMTRVVKMTVWKLFYKWWLDNPEARLIWGAVLAILYGIAFFRATRGTGITLYIILLAGGAFVCYRWPWAELLALPILLPVWVLCERSLRQRRGKYLPAIASVEGGGVKRGLSAPEAAMVLELPLGRVLTLIIFGLLRKRVLVQVRPEPLEVQPASEYAGKTHKERTAQARAAGTVIHAYEQGVLDEIEAHPGLPLNAIGFGVALKRAIAATAARMKGFDLERTRSYYRYIVSRAWTEAKALGDLRKRTEYADDNLLWLMTDWNAYDNFGLWHHHGYHYDPPWSRVGIGDVGAGQIPSPSVGGKTSFADVSQSFAGWAEGLAGGLASKIDPGSVGLKTGGLVDLSGVDKVTVDMLESMAENRGGGGGGGGGGGCACAGCACACACAGGGR